MVGGKPMAGVVHEFQDSRISFDPRCTHSTERWGGDRVVLVAYMPRDLRKLSKPDVSYLTSLGFKLSAAAPQSVHVRAEFGIRWSPEEFVSQAIKVEHPCHMRQLLPAEVREVLESNFKEGSAAVCQHRTAKIREWIGLANSPVAKEEELHRQFSPNRRAVLKDKRFPVLRHWYISG